MDKVQIEYKFTSDQEQKADFQNCRELIISHHSSLVESERAKLRNQTFKIMKPYMAKWIQAILADQKVYISPQEIISKSWDCFEYSLEHFKPHKKIGVANHFYSYTRFYLLMNRPGLKMNTPIKSDKEEVYHPDHEGRSLPDENLFNDLQELNAFRKTLDENQKVVFDDAVISLAPRNRDKQQRIKESGLTQAEYRLTKKMFKLFIDFLIRR